MITKFNLFENLHSIPDEQTNELLNDIWELDRSNTYSITAWLVLKFETKEHKGNDYSYIVIFDDESQYTLMHDYYIEDENFNDFIEISNSFKLDFTDKEATMKVVNDYINNHIYLKFKKIQDFNL